MVKVVRLEPAESPEHAPELTSDKPKPAILAALLAGNLS